MRITYDPGKRRCCLVERVLDFEDAVEVFEFQVFAFEDEREAYGEKRMVCFGLLRERLTVVGYVQHGNVRHVFSMRKANRREQARYGIDPQD